MKNSELPPDSQNLAFVEGMYARYARDRASVPSDWRNYFDSLLNGERPSAGVRLEPSFRPASLFGAAGFPRSIHPEPAPDLRPAGFQDRVNQLIRNYRMRGHMIAKLDPLGLSRPTPPELELEFFGFTEQEMDLPVTSQTFQYKGRLTLRELIERLRNTYCRSIGVQYMHVGDLSIRRWLQRRMEGTENRLELSREEQLRILTRLTDAVTFEEFIRKKYIGAKSFSLEGCESLIPLLDLAIEKAGEQGIKEIVFGMAHRGRLNVLANIIGMHSRRIFRLFEDKDPKSYTGQGDVKYHLGHSNDWITSGGHRIHLSLTFNPSHLEFVNPVAQGRVRAKQDRVSDLDRKQSMALLIHGDAALAGEGAVQETLNLCRLPAYDVGGTLHVVINNQIGFTTPPSEGRSGMYATEVARMIQAPIFHVNGEDPEAVAQVIRLAMDYRFTFNLDVFIDMYGYRRLGHNEGDEPSFTQPMLYRAIEKRKSVREGYLDHLLELKGVTREEADRVASKRRAHLEEELAEARSEDYKRQVEKLQGVWSRGNYVGGPESEVEEVDTGFVKKRLAELLAAQARLPEDFHPHPKIERLLEHRREMAAGKKPLDWAAAEALAFASLAVDGVRVRLTGQDSARGTFSHRHAVLSDVEDGRLYAPLQHLDPKQAPVEIFNSPLSEAGVLGFDYGYSLECPDGLVLWEAQFGDFVNGAQVIIDQFITSAEDKWQRLSGLVLLLPHGFEGQGPEHSSARPERFLQLAAEDNIQIVNPSTPAQFFHVLRRQALRPWRKPLIVLTPKSLLRHPKVVSSLDDCAQGRFERALPDTRQSDQAKTSRILLCSGKIYYELEEQREERNRNDVAIVRLEQWYPLRDEPLANALKPCKKGTPVFWVQEEPENMGAWSYLRVRFGEKLFDRFPFAGICRPASASPATGSHSSHKLEQAKLLDEAFGKPPSASKRKKH